MATLQFYWNRHLLLHNLLVLFHLIVCPHALPRQVPLNQIHKHIANRLQIVSATLLYAEMSIDRGISGCSCKILVFFVRNMLMRFGITILFAESEVDEMSNMALFSQSHQEVLRLNVTVDVVLRV